MRRFQKNAKKVFQTPLSLVRQYNSPKPYTAVLQLSYREIFIFLNIQGKILQVLLTIFFRSILNHFLIFTVYNVHFELLLNPTKFHEKELWYRIISN